MKIDPTGTIIERVLVATQGEKEIDVVVSLVDVLVSMAARYGDSPDPMRRRIMDVLGYKRKED
jgi:hypothetical protein